MKQYSRHNLAGCVCQRRVRGLIVRVYHAEQAGLDPGDGETKWYAVCENHNRLIGTRTLASAKSAALEPEEWCGLCNGQEKEES